jgi:monomeric isocitrate dehydrogenase
LVLAQTLDEATGKVLENNRSPESAVGTLDNRGSHFYLALYWAEALAAQKQDKALAEEFAPIAKALATNEKAIIAELTAVQGQKIDLHGYYHPSTKRTSAVMLPSSTFRSILGL